MRTFAQITAIIFMFLGVLIILGGVVFAFSGAFGQTTTPSVPSIIPDMTGLVILAKIIGGAAIGLQGLFLAAIGEVLWFLAGIFEQTQKTAVELFSLARPTTQPRKY
jgi:hypothetical protein